MFCTGQFIGIQAAHSRYSLQQHNVSRIQIHQICAVSKDNRCPFILIQKSQLIHALTNNQPANITASAGCNLPGHVVYRCKVTEFIKYEVDSPRQSAVILLFRYINQSLIHLIYGRRNKLVVYAALVLGDDKYRALLLHEVSHIKRTVCGCVDNILVQNERCKTRCIYRI